MNYPSQSYPARQRGVSSRRIAVTGLGAVSPAGIGVAPFWQALVEGRSVIAPITRFDAADLDSRIAGEVRDFDPARWIEPRLKPKRLSRQAQFALVAAQEAARDAGLNSAALRKRRVAVVLGSSLYNVEEIAESALKIERRGVGQAGPTVIPSINMQSQATAVADLFEIDDVMAMGVSNACASGMDAVTTAADLIRSGRFDVVICGGTDSPISRSPMAELVAGGFSSARNAEPERASRPFDRERDTGLLSEGAGILVLEDVDVALDRGATPYLEILGSHSCLDPQRDVIGSGLEHTIRVALENANCRPADVDFISAWGSGHPILDRCETAAIKKNLGEHAYQVGVCSIKGAIGNPLAAAGPLQIIAVAHSYRQGLLPPTANYEHGDIDCDLDYIAGKPRRARLRHALLNAHGLGGSNTSVVVGPPPA